MLVKPHFPLCIITINEVGKTQSTLRNIIPIIPSLTFPIIKKENETKMLKLVILCLLFKPVKTLGEHRIQNNLKTPTTIAHKKLYFI
jgi:hypothetical protein